MEYSEFEGCHISRLGFGMMRLPLAGDGKIDLPLVEKMVDLAIEHGINYFDTAFPYHDGMSEIVTARILKNYPKNRYYLATKYPGHQYAPSYHPAEIFEEQLKKCQTEYFDFYLLHNVTESTFETYTSRKWNILDYFLLQKAQGRIRHLGFSSHAECATLEKFLDYCGEKISFCQIQLNYLDWTLQKAKQKYDMLCARNIPVWVMEPVRGGKLARLDDNAMKKLQVMRPGANAASWAFNWLRALPQVKVILSGMSSLAQVSDNIDTFNESKPLNAGESRQLLETAKCLHQQIPCTACRYCTPHCPKHLDIPTILALYGDARFSQSVAVGMRMETIPEPQWPSACTACGACAKVCPQKIDIPQKMREFTSLLPKIPNWREICRQRQAAADALKKRGATPS